jgi:hypothetical protein
VCSLIALVLRESNDKLIARCTENDLSALQEVLELHDMELAKNVVRAVSMPGVRVLLSRKAEFPAIEEIILEEAALAGRGEIVHHVLEQHPNLILSETVRCYAVYGGVSVWKELVAFDPEIVNVEIGHHGDALGLAVGENDLELVRFLLEEGKADIEQSNYATMPVLPFAKRRKRKQEIIDLLISHGARMKKTVDD